MKLPLRSGLQGRAFGGTEDIAPDDVALADRDAAASDEPRADHRESGCILLVDDEVAFRELIQTFLAASGFAVTTAGNGLEAAHRVRMSRFDAVVTDLCMPDNDGMELIMALRKMPAAPPVIVMSGGVGDDIAGMLRMAELLGAQRTLAKPFPLQALVAIVREVMAEAKAEPRHAVAG